MTDSDTTSALTSERSHGDDGDTDLESENTETSEQEDHANIVWTGSGKKTPVIVFKADALIKKKPELKSIGERYHLAYKMVKTESKLIRSVLGAHGFHEAHPNSPDFNLMWTGSHLKPYTLRSLQEFQKINHFPRSYEITRKDRLYKNIQRMQQTKGMKHFDILPQSFITPAEFQDFCSAFLKEKGPWIVKPIASSRGRGIFLVNHPDEVPVAEQLIISKYLRNPYLVDGFKFDIRLYVAVTSYDPLQIYMYEEGLTRFATVKYDKAAKNIRNNCMHLTNYSINKKSNDFVKNDDPDIEDYGNKWSLGALLRYLRNQGKDTTALMMRIEDVVIKTLLAAELPIATACKMFMPFRGNCFEVYGFDILIDDNLRPWILEVNLSPSLACDSPLDLKIKSHMISELFTLTGFMCQDPMTRNMQSKRNQDVLTKSKRQRPLSASSNISVNNLAKKSAASSSQNPLTGEEIRIVRRAKEEHARRGGWIRIFPSPDSWDLYGAFMQFTTTNNLMLHQQLFPDRARPASSKPSSSGTHSLLRVKNLHMFKPDPHLAMDFEELKAHAHQRSIQYERKISSLGTGKKNKNHKRRQSAPAGAPSGDSHTVYRGMLLQGEPVDTTQIPTQKQSQLKTQPITQARKPPPAPPKLRTPSPEEPPPPPKVEPPPPKPVTPPLPPPPQYNIVEVLESGGALSKVQARYAFAMYLMRVQERLVKETGSLESDDGETANEQMDLVLRFLKRAAGNLQQPFKVIVPSRKLPINDRRRILAKQLGDFVHIYNKETEQLKQRRLIEKKMKRDNVKEDKLRDDKFTHFVDRASESDLEEVLTTYTKLNKSASIFLGSNSNTSSHSRPSSAQRGQGHLTKSQSESMIHKRREGDGSENPSEPKEAPSYWTKTEPVIDASMRPPSGHITTASGNPLSSYAGAVQIYSSKVTSQGPSVKQRPLSASSHRSSASRVGINRPSSASSQRNAAHSHATTLQHRERPDGSSAPDDYAADNEAMNSALQRLAIRQRTRQYSAKGANILQAPKPKKIESTSTALIDTMNKDSQGDGDKGSSWNADKGSSWTSQSQARAHSAGSGATQASLEFRSFNKSNNSHVQRTISEDVLIDQVQHAQTRSDSADETFNSFIEDSTGAEPQQSPRWQNELIAAYNHVTGVAPSESYNPSKTSTQYSMASANHTKQQQMIQQSKNLLQQSKAKHQAMIAQAHMARKSKVHGDHEGDLQGDPESALQKYAPKPPPGRPSGDKKSGSTHRLARAAVQDDNVYGTNFYSNLSYDTATGKSKSSNISYNSGYNAGTGW
ncbi:unnamed protein product [Owenia fusiformis]|uniref:Tubulin--tyrosine ligase-like protein 5 n=1 Tax=Owenia fusiformis TaxID=6347 RepID=A0A8S4PI52_OWEFU|nr:unnamed protein product [Owenia fusiformis]